MSTAILYKKYNNSWKSYRRCISATCSSTIYLMDILHSVAPTGIFLTMVQPINDRLVGFKGTDYTDIDTIPPLIALNCDAYWILYDSTIKEKYCTPWVAEGLRDENSFAICDVSYKPKLQANSTTVAWVIENSTSADNMFGKVATIGIRTDLYRGILLGIYTLLSAVSYIER